jgi:hypothetical protein
VKCSKRHFQCGNGLCIHASFVCDGEPDCEDKSDEDSKICIVTGNLLNLTGKRGYKCNVGFDFFVLTRIWK